MTSSRHFAVLLAVLSAFSISLAFADGKPRLAAPAAPSASATTDAPRNVADGMPCSACHTTAAWRDRSEGGAGQAFDHSKTGFPLTGEHRQTPCVGCHASNRSIQRACVNCHDDAHGGRLSQACDRCHSSAGWRATRPIEIHRLTRFPLTGMHVLADCSECHRRASERRFTDAPVACFGCHEQEYRRPNLFPVHVGTATDPPFSRDCSQCHRALAWVPATGLSASSSTSAALQVAPRNHDLRFPISFGVHRTASCDDCHVSRATPRAVRCIGCHAHDPVRLAEEHRNPISTDGPSCLSCHQAGARR